MPMPSAIVAKPSAWNIGAPIGERLAGAERDLVQQRADLDQRLGLGARGALRRPGRAAGEDDHLECSSGLGGGGSAPAGGEALELVLVDDRRALERPRAARRYSSSQIRTLVPSRSATSRICGPAKSVLSRISARAELGRAEHRVEEAAVVARQEATPSPAPMPRARSALRDGVGARGRARPGERAAARRSARAVAVAGGGGGEQAAQRAVARDRPPDLGGAVRQVGREHARADQHAGGARLRGRPGGRWKRRRARPVHSIPNADVQLRRGTGRARRASPACRVPMPRSRSAGRRPHLPDDDVGREVLRRSSTAVASSAAWRASARASESASGSRRCSPSARTAAARHAHRVDELRLARHAAHGGRLGRAREHAGVADRVVDLLDRVVVDGQSRQVAAARRGQAQRLARGEDARPRSRRPRRRGRSSSASWAWSGSPSRSASAIASSALGQRARARARPRAPTVFSGSRANRSGPTTTATAAADQRGEEARERGAVRPASPASRAARR